MQSLSSREKFGRISILLLTTLIWGFSFVAQSAAVAKVPPFTINAIRYVIGVLFLLPFVLYRKPVWSAEQIKAGVYCGIVLFIASSLQQAGMLYTSSGKAGLITTFYIVLVPLLSLFLGRKNRPVLWLACAIALCGLYFLSISGQFTINKGDLLIFVCAFFFSIHILLIDHYSPRVDNIAMSATQFAVAAILSGISALFTEHPTMEVILEAKWPILYLGVFSCGIAYTLQIVGQRGLNPAFASLILSLEAAFAVLGGFLFLGERMTPREILGCCLMFAAVILAQWPERDPHNPTKSVSSRERSSL